MTIGSRIRAFDWYQNHRPWMTLNDLERPKRTLLHKRCVFWSPLHKFEWRYRPIGLLSATKKCRPMNLVSENIRFMRIFAGFPWAVTSNDVPVCRRRQFLAISVTTSSKSSEIRQAIGYYMMIRYAAHCGPVKLSAKWMTLSGYFMSKSAFGQHFFNQSVWMSKINTASAILRCSVHCMIS